MAYEITFLVCGIVQGVGFRPFCAKLAQQMGLGGTVRNTSDGVEIILRGKREDVDKYILRLKKEKPDVSTITSIEFTREKYIDQNFSSEFSIVKSRRMYRQRVLIPPDIATCQECLDEMDDPANRRYGYPFINCTNCGPRYTIIKNLPYDRPETTMEKFEMCPDCYREYNSEKDRRYHAQPNACFVCGPSLWVTDSDGNIVEKNRKALDASIDSLRSGKILAIKGLGGFHLACDPFNGQAIEKLRRRKKRKGKPFALMVKDLSVAEDLCIIREEEKELLRSSKRPIVICYRTKNCRTHEGVAPGQDTLGIMLPYTPLHHLIMKEFDALVMTSANISDSPIIADNSEALMQLGSVADLFLMHNRDIHMPIDDSVISNAGKVSILIRRSRGFVPSPLGIPVNAPVVLGAGGEMKSTFSLTQEKILFPGQYLGDLKQLPTVNYYRKALRHFMKLYNLQPEYLVCDMHPQYISTSIAAEETGIQGSSILQVQHHHAHFASCLAENEHWDEAIGLILDGTGYGTDGTIWGGEFLTGDIKVFSRAGHFLSSVLPGGEKAVLEPWRYALSLLNSTFDKVETFSVAEKIWPDKKHLIPIILQTIDEAPVTTSAGRLFDGVSAILGISPVISYDGEAAINLEAQSKGSMKAPFGFFKEKGKWILDWRDTVHWIVQNRDRLSNQQIASAFHFGLSEALSNIAEAIAADTGIRHVVLSGGVWQNRRLLNLTRVLLKRKGLIPLVHKYLSPNDECVSAGQAVIGAFKWSLK
jgi:hydrogenase maturation protein HypF